MDAQKENVTHFLKCGMLPEVIGILGSLLQMWTVLFQFQ